MKIIDLENQTDLPVDIDALEKIAQSLTTREIELVIVGNQSMQALNLAHRDKEKPTDVLSFPMETPFTEQSLFDIPLGSVVISADLVREKAHELDHNIQDELSLLFIHGILHLLGFDHEKDEEEMREKEEMLIAEFDLPKSLIVRTGQ